MLNYLFLSSLFLFLNSFVTFSGTCNQDDWISAVRPVIEKRILK